ncbi:hypothetical protein HDC34_001053 [Pseudoclavibacter sp. JAI123]|uniref:glycosyltransferase family 2 protein n=1 Tax=Pseudoclavibacter sp. JAI123 TaxID=2723065 RepID=UPI0015CCE848|nr:glycosyltransferase family A protein [Pseudoclavibacter sp. JAI123]NYF12759.1 hypothetical protein [Pseudoclavibacter sp. JAI123]
MDNSSPDVTIVVIGYKHAAFIEQCLESIAAQTVQARCIVIDDASGDDTEQVAEAWFAEHPEAQAERIYHQENRGLVGTLNEALRKIETPYFAYIAADDWMEPRRVELQLEAALEAGPECALIYSDVFRADGAGRRFEESYAQIHREQWLAAEDPDAYSRLLVGNWIPAPSVMLRTDAVRAVGGYDEDIFFEDHDMYLRLAQRFGVTWLAQPLATHRELDDSYGHRMFFTAEGQRDFQKAQVSLLIKHAGAEQARSAGIQEKLRVRISQLYWEGESPAWIHSNARLLIRALPKPDLKLRLISMASGLGISGRSIRTLTAPGRTRREV